MIEIIGVKFKDTGKVYHFSPGNNKVNQGDSVIVETTRGIELGTVAFGNRETTENDTGRSVKPILRVATKTDIDKAARNKNRESEVLETFAKKVEAHKLPMKPVGVEIAFDGAKILFYFSADGRVDFRELVKDLASVFRTRIELRQIGVRDEAKLLGGLGICGRKFCCSSFLNEFHPVSIKMAKEQSLSLNPVKISGTCGRLMCCLKYEQDCYEELIKTTPKQGAYVETTEGKGTVEDVNILTGVLKVRVGIKENSKLISVKKEEVKVLKDGYGRNSTRLSREEAAALRKLEET